MRSSDPNSTEIPESSINSGIWESPSKFGQFWAYRKVLTIPPVQESSGQIWVNFGNIDKARLNLNDSDNENDDDDKTMNDVGNSDAEKIWN